MKRIFALVAFALVAAACSGDSGATSTTAAPTTPVPTTTAAPATTTAPTTAAASTTTQAAPEARIFVGADGVEADVTDTSRIVSLNGDITEILFELGVGANVAAVDVTTTFPAEAAALPQVGFGQRLAAEGVLALGPTLVIGDQQVGPPETIQQLRDAGVPVVILQTQSSLEGVAIKITQVAEIVGEAAAGEALAAQVNDEIEAARALVQPGGEPPKVAYVYVRGPQTLLFFGAGMPTQAMIEGAGALDVSVLAGVFGPQPLTPEALVAAAPEVLVLPAAGFGALGGPEALLAVPGVADTPAGQSGNFLVYEEGYFFGLGPRTGMALEEFIRDLYPDLG